VDIYAERILSKLGFNITHLKNRLLLVLILSLGIVNCNSPCAELTFQAPENSPYILPYPIGQVCELSQSYCSPWGHKNRLAYDIKMDIGQVITASRPGVVIETKNAFPDTDHQPGHNNRVVIKHVDGSLAWYAHLQQKNVYVNVGETLSYGDTLGKCGQSGRSGAIPHLHFEVFAARLYDYTDALPVSFSNIEGFEKYVGVLDTRIPLKALPY